MVVGPEEPYDGLKPVISRGARGPGSPGKFLKTERWKMHPGILGLETLTSEGLIKLQLYRDNHVTQRKTK